MLITSPVDKETKLENRFLNSKFLAKWMSVAGLSMGLFYAVGSLIIDLLTIDLNAGTAMTFGAIMILPVLFGVFGIILSSLLDLLVITRNKIKGSIHKK